MTKLGERTIILQIHLSYVEDFKISDKIGGAYDHLADSLIIIAYDHLAGLKIEKHSGGGLRPPGAAALG